MPGSPISLAAAGDLELTSRISWIHELSDFSCQCRDTLLMNAPEGQYLFSFSTKYGRECHRHLQFTVGFLTDNIFIPNSFSPNGDQINDVFEVFAPRHEIMSMQIYNRWGGKVFATHGPEFSWGAAEGVSNNEAGVYLYQVILRDANNDFIRRVGSVTLLR